jgi:cell wall-associated NlpC family hydrolase
MTRFRRLAVAVLVLVVAAAGAALLRVTTASGSAAAGTVSAQTRTLAQLNPAPLVLPRLTRSQRLGLRAVAVAREQIGRPYSWGGASPSGFDCSGLVAYVYARLGVRLPHNAAAQFGVGRTVGLADAQPGDLIFFHGLGHVGILTGSGRYIHAPRSGRRVEVGSLASRRGTIDGVRRVSVLS